MNEITINKKALIIIIVAIAIFIGFVIFIAFKIKNDVPVSELEKIKLNEISEKTMNYIEIIEESNSSEIDKYVVFALEYSYNEHNKDTLTLKQVQEFINDIFIKDISTEELSLLGVTPLMLMNGISYNPIEEKFTKYDNKQSYSEIAAKPITKYLLTDIEKNKNEYILTFDKYVVTEPYEILNYYIEMNNQDYDKDIQNNITEIDNYLKGEEKIRTIKKYITEENVEFVANKKKSISVVYLIKDGKILIDRIEN